jgi:hypothetical protein
MRYDDSGLDKFNEEMHGKSEEEKAQRIYGDWRPQDMAITQPEELLRTETQRIPVEYLENLGEVKDSALPPAADPFKCDQAPFQLDPANFTDESGFPDPKSFEERLEAALEFIPIGAEIDFDELKNGIVLEETK